MQVCTNCGSVTEDDHFSIVTTPLPNLINANPTRSEQRVIRETLLSLNTGLSQLDSEIDRVESNLNELRRRREVLTDTCQRYKEFLSPIQHLPSEILSEIFVRSLPHDWQHNIYNFRRAVMLVASINQYWRNVALSTPSLWSSISLYLEVETTEAEIDSIRTWLGRSGTFPLSFRLEWYIDHSIPAHPIIDIFTERAELWKHAEFSMPPSMLNCIRSVKHRLIGLQTLKIDTCAAGELLMAYDAFEIAPQLTSVIVEDHISLRSIQFPWTQLTSVDILVGFSIEECYELLCMATNLMECCLSIWGPELDSPRAIIHHTRLHTVKIYSIDDTSTVFDFLSLPALCSFEFCDLGGRWAQTQFISFLSRSACSLEKLVLGASLSDNCLIACLSLMPSLTYLQLEDSFSSSSMTNTLLTLLTLPHSAPQATCLVPRLEYISTDCLTGSGAAFADMIGSRRRFTAMEGSCTQQMMPPLKTVRFRMPRTHETFTPSILSRLRDFAKEGLDIKQTKRINFKVVAFPL